MQEKTDAQLLRYYAEHRDEAAFREIVSRHADVIYASALRQVNSPDLAHDIAQSVFTDLARKAQPLAGTLTEDASLLGWLFRSTRFLALNQLRDDRRRVARERQAMENFDPASETVPEWERVQPVLDGALAELSDEDRDALLLRFFKNRDFRAIGAALGVSDDAAQKRVSRALERLRTQLTSRGVTTTAVALSTALSTFAVPLAPAGLAATLSTAALAGTTLATTATATAIKTIAMTTLQKTLITATIAVSVGTGIYEARQASILQTQVQTLQQRQVLLAEEVQELKHERDDATRQLAALGDDNERLNRNTAELLKLRGEVARLRGDSEALAKLKAGNTANENDPLQSAMKLWVARVNELKQRLEEMPEKKIPELQFLSSDDWLEVGQGYFENEQGSNIRRVLADLRLRAKVEFAKLAGQALDDFILANDGDLPNEISQLKPYFTNSVSDSMLERYKLLRTGKLAAFPRSESIIAEKAIVDDREDTLFTIGAYGWAWQGTGMLIAGKSDGTWDTSRINAFMKK